MNNVDVWQSWDNVIDYVKSELGAPIINIELTDDQIMDQIKNHVLPLFSRYSPYYVYYIMTEENNCIQENPTKIYQFKNFPYKIIRIDQIIAKPSLIDWNQNFATSLYATDITDLLGANYALQSKLVVLAQDTYSFIPPDKIELIKSQNSVWIYDDFIVKVACVHQSPATIDPDMYDYCRKLSLARIMKILGTIRAKFQNFATPAGQIQLNSEQMRQEGMQLEREIMDQLDRLPPDHYVYFIDD